MLRHRIPSLYTTGAAAILGGIFFRSLGGPIDTDLWWHLATGRRIAESGQVPRTDWMTFTFAGRPWVAQSWLADLVTWAGYRSGGLAAVSVLFAAATAVAFAFFHDRMRRRDVPQPLALTLLVAASLASALSWGPRVQMLSLLLVSVFLHQLDRYAATGTPRPLLTLPPLMALWVNLHGAFVLGVIVIAIDGLASILDRRTERTRALGVTLLATIGATLLNPVLFRVWDFPLRTMVPGLFHAEIAEAVSPDFHHPAFLPFELLLLLLVASFLVSRQFAWRDLLLALALTHLALSQVRHVSVWAVAVVPLIGGHLASGWHERGGGAVFTQDLGPEARRGLDFAVLAFVVVTYAVVFGNHLRRTSFRELERRDFPAEAADLLLVERTPQRVFTTFEWGGYLSWRLDGRGQVFIDGRANSLFDDATLRDYLTIVRGRSGWQERLAATRAGLVVIPASTPLAPLLRVDPRWRCTTGGRGVAVCRAAVHAAGTSTSP